MPETNRWDSRFQRAAEIDDLLTRNLYVVGIVSAAAERRGIEVILVGGTAQAFYTSGGYETRDIDIVSPQRHEFAKLLHSLGFERAEGSRHWYHPQANAVLEVPDEVLAGSKERVAEVTVEGLTIRVIGIEDLILDRLRAGMHWQSEADLDWAARLLALHESRIDHSYLVAQANGEQLTAALSVAMDRAARWRIDA